MAACNKMALMDVRPEMNALRPMGGIVNRRPGERRMNNITATHIYNLIIKLKDVLRGIIVLTMDTKRKFIPVPVAPYVYKTYIAAEMDALMREWYVNLGQTISPEELKICREIDLTEVAAAATAATAAAAKAAAAKPVYGTPEFWKAHWAKKKAGAAGTGCPPKVVKAKRTPATPKCAK